MIGDSIFGREGIQRKDAKENRLDNHTSWQALKCECDSDGTEALFDCLDVPFNFCTLLILDSCVKVDTGKNM